MDWITGLTIGLIGSLHCLGMCGPIALALPLPSDTWFRRISGSLLYNFGRTLTYAVMGALFGLLGKGIELAGLQQWASIGIGVIMIISVLFPVIFRNKLNLTRWFTGYAGRLTGSFRKLFMNESMTGLFSIGLLNGLLPCGLVYVALAGALNTGAVLPAILFMVMFGLGTIPALLVLSLAGNVISIPLRRKLSRIVPVFVVILGLIFILRGMNLGIPYISPKSEKLHIREMVDKKPECCAS
jgi:uncharacterized protein